MLVLYPPKLSLNRWFTGRSVHSYSAPPAEPDIPELEGRYEFFHSETIENSPDLYTYKGSHEGAFCAISTKTLYEGFFSTSTTSKLLNS